MIKKQRPISKNNSLIAALVMLSVLPVAHAHSSTNYVGLDGVYSFMGFKTNYGGNMFVKRAPGLNLFYGHKFNDIFGVEVGYEAEANKSKTSVVYVGDYAAGRTVSNVVADNHEDYITKLYQRNPYLGVSFQKSITGNTGISLLFGASYTHVRAVFNLYNTALGSSNLTRTFSKSKLVPMVRAAAEYNFTNNWGARLTASWRNTDKFKMKHQELPGTFGQTYLRAKNTFSVGFGVLYTI